MQGGPGSRYPGSLQQRRPWTNARPPRVVRSDTRLARSTMSSRDTTVQPVEVARDEARALFAHTMTLVAITAAFFAGGAYLGRDMSQGAGFLWFIASFACLFGIRFALERSEQLSIGLLFGFGVLIGLAVAPTIAYYAKTDPQAVWQAG